MRNGFVSLSYERRMAKKKVSWWKRQPLTQLVSVISLVISLSTAALSYRHYEMDEKAQTQPYRTAIYTIRLASYGRLNEKVADWIKIATDETSLHRNIEDFNSGVPNPYIRLAVISKKATLLSSNALAFYQAQILEWRFWPKQRHAFEAFDPAPMRMIDCSLIVAKAVVAAQRLQRPDLFRPMLEQADPQCRWKQIANSTDLNPYARVMNAVETQLKSFEEGGQ